jgi:hypothetical protein
MESGALLVLVLEEELVYELVTGSGQRTVLQTDMGLVFLRVLEMAHKTGDR